MEYDTAMITHLAQHLTETLKTALAQHSRTGETVMVFVYRVVRAWWVEDQPQLWSRRLSWPATGLH